MKSLPDTPFLYPILDSAFSPDLIKDAKALLRAGVKIFQVRAKDRTRGEIFKTVNELLPECLAREVILIVNDYVDITIVTDAHGVHLGQDDFPVPDARDLLGDRMIGISTHNENQLRVANAWPVNYIAIGPMFLTSTKRNAAPELGIPFLREMRRISKLPLVCIGGINASHIRDLIRAGANGIAMISELYKGNDLYSSVRRLSDEVESAFK